MHQNSTGLEDDSPDSPKKRVESVRGFTEQGKQHACTQRGWYFFVIFLCFGWLVVVVVKGVTLPSGQTP